MNTKHTPGPWTFYQESSYERGESYGVRAPAPHQFVIPSLNINPADAHLIAAAPDMLAALKVAEQFMSIASDWNFDEAEINGEMRSTYDWIDVIRAAIAKAGGVV